MIDRSLGSLVVLVAAALTLGSEVYPTSAPPAPLVGFSFSPSTSQQAMRDPLQDLGLLLTAIDPDLVRLPVYWESVAPTPTRLDFSSVDALLAVVAVHNRVSTRQTLVVPRSGRGTFCTRSCTSRHGAARASSRTSTRSTTWAMTSPGRTR